MTLQQQAAFYFGVTLPVERDTLKSAYRTAAKRLHTDVSGADTKDAFVIMKAAYDALCDEKATGVFTDGPALQATEEGTPLSELGLGLGNNKNGATCQTCKGVGYRTEKDFRTEWKPRPPCAWCQMTRSTLGCRTCGPRGFSHRQVNTVTYKICAPCQGTGEIEMFNPCIPKGLLAGFGRKR